MANGILIVDKPAGWTSQDVAAKLRGVFHEKRVGHGGTLDPMATGVLPIFVGRATRAVPFFEHADKVYETVLRLGLITDTQDTTGRTLEEREVDITSDQLESALAAFRGEIQQIPPMYSAVKIGGQKLYALARQGKEVERKPRPVTIFALRAGEPAGNDWPLTVHCSKGTYVRTLCHDVGQTLGCGGCMAALRRTRAGGFDLSRAYTMDEILAAPDPEALLLPVDSLFSDCPALTVNEAGERKLRNGAPLRVSGRPDGRYRVYSAKGEFLLLAEICRQTLTTVKSFFEPVT